MKFSMTGQENYDLLILVSDCLIEVTTWVGLTTLPSQKSYRSWIYVSELLGWLFCDFSIGHLDFRAVPTV